MQDRLRFWEFSYTSEIFIAFCFQAHANCHRLLPAECNFGSLREILLPSSCLSMPRMDLSVETMMGMSKKTSELGDNLYLFALLTKSIYAKKGLLNIGTQLGLE